MHTGVNGIGEWVLLVHSSILAAFLRMHLYAETDMDAHTERHCTSRQWTRKHTFMYTQPFFHLPRYRHSGLMAVVVFAYTIRCTTYIYITHILVHTYYTEANAI